MFIWIALGICLIIVLINRFKQKEKEDFEQRKN